MNTRARRVVSDEGSESDEESLERESLRQMADLLAKILDTAVPIPGTSLRVGLDPLLGLVPGIGDTIANVIGSGILVLATRLGIPRIVLVRMSVNMFLNGAIGAIPIFGDAFSVWFRSNARNAALLRRHSQRERRPGTTVDWIFVVGLGVVTLGAMVAVIAAILWACARLWSVLTN
ncbi:hypothetical protein YTPLAS18_18830 [Nitrospira sp.]|nr:hypothetical protein YTPLAS18_18830 [Nitrospira sp.]